MLATKYLVVLWRKEEAIWLLAASGGCFQPPQALPFVSLGARENEGGWGLLSLEARVRIELTHKGFADLSLTTWVPRLQSECLG
jgi:hypothetical protein